MAGTEPRRETPNFPSFEHLSGEPHQWEGNLCLHLWSCGDSSSNFLQTIFYCLNHIPLPPFFLRLIFILCPYTKGYVPCSPLLNTFILGSFFIQDKQNKEIRSFFFFFFLMFLPLIGFTVWGFGKNHLEDGTSLQILFRSQGQWSPSTNKRRKGIYMASLIIEFKWFLFLYLLNFPKPGPPYYKSSW